MSRLQKLRRTTTTSNSIICLLGQYRTKPISPRDYRGAVKLKYSISIFVANVAVGLYVNERHTMMKGNSKFMKRDSKFGQRRINAHATANRLLLISRTLAWFYLLARNQPSSGEFLQKI